MKTSENIYIPMLLVNSERYYYTRELLELWLKIYIRTNNLFIEPDYVQFDSVLSHMAYLRKNVYKVGAIKNQILDRIQQDGGYHIIRFRELITSEQLDFLCSEKYNLQEYYLQLTKLIK